MSVASRMICSSLFAISVCVALFAAQQAEAEDNHVAPSVISEAKPTYEQLETQIAILRDQLKKRPSNTVRSVGAPIENNSALWEAYYEAKKKEYSYQAALMDANVQTFYAQKIASYAILVLVLFVVLSGVAFSGYQLWKSVAVAGVQSNSDFELSASKVRVTSSVVGIVVLTISLVFLFIYTHEVYHVKLIDVTPSQQAEDG
jgi:hypothetical protein